MRLDKWLKVSRLIKRRTVAQIACEQGRVFVNDRTAKSSLELKVGDKVHMELGSKAITVEVKAVPQGAVPAQSAGLDARRTGRGTKIFTSVDWF